jgi:hypothetical protein
MSSALINRMCHVELVASPRDWLAWAGAAGIHQYILEYIGLRPDHLWRQPPKTEEPFSTPRSWHILSDALYSFGDTVNDNQLEILASGCLSPQHAVQFRAFVKQIRNRYALAQIISGEQKWPAAPEDRDVLYFLAQSFRTQLVKELPADKGKLSANTSQLSMRAKSLMKDLAGISLEIAQMIVASADKAASDGGNETLPDWFMVELVRDLPRLAAKEK